MWCLCSSFSSADFSTFELAAGMVGGAVGVEGSSTAGTGAEPERAAGLAPASASYRDGLTTPPAGREPTAAAARAADWDGMLMGWLGVDAGTAGAGARAGESSMKSMREPSAAPPFLPSGLPPPAKKSKKPQTRTHRAHETDPSVHASAQRDARQRHIKLSSLFLCDLCSFVAGSFLSAPSSSFSPFL